MAYAYIEGAELQALQYYESLLAVTLDAAERSKIAGILCDIRDTLKIEDRLKQVSVQTSIGSANLST
jgi:hypothetical protein